MSTGRNRANTPRGVSATAQVVASTQINAEPEAVWALMSDPHRYAGFVDATERMIDVPDGEFGVGYVYKEYGGIRPFLGESERRPTAGLD